MLTKIDVVLGSVVRNCCRCGGEFRMGGQERVCQGCRKPRRHKSDGLGRHLTLREKQVVDLVSQAKLNKEIAYELHLSEGTIKEYLNKVYRKLGVKNRTELAVWSFVIRQNAASRQLASDVLLQESETLHRGAFTFAKAHRKPAAVNRRREEGVDRAAVSTVHCL